MQDLRVFHVARPGCCAVVDSFHDVCIRMNQPRAKRLKIVLYNPRAVFFTMPLALLAIGSELDPERYEVIIVDGRLESDPERALLSHLEGALCLGVTVLTGAPISDALQISRAAKRARADLTV